MFQALFIIFVFKLTKVIIIWLFFYCLFHRQLMFEYILNKLCSFCLKYLLFYLKENYQRIIRNFTFLRRSLKLNDFMKNKYKSQSNLSWIISIRYSHIVTKPSSNYRIAVYSCIFFTNYINIFTFGLKFILREQYYKILKIKIFLV